MLAGKRVLVTGVLTRHSIAFAVAQRAQRYGADVVLTGFGRSRRLTERAARRLDPPVEILELDVRCEQDFHALTAALAERGGVDGALHAIAHAPADALGGRFLETPTESALSAFEVSAVSLKSLAKALVPIFDARGSGSIVALDFDAAHVLPGYDWMGVAKAGLEGVNRYLAYNLGGRRIRVNLVAAGSLRTEAAAGIPDFDLMARRWEECAPLGWDSADPGPVADAVCFLLSDAARGITGEILHVDGGCHTLGAASADGAPVQAPTARES